MFANNEDFRFNLTKLSLHTMDSKIIQNYTMDSNKIEIVNNLLRKCSINIVKTLGG